MTVRQRPQWTTVEIASHALNQRDLRDISIDEVHKLASRVLDDEKNSPNRNKTDPKPPSTDPIKDMLKSLREGREGK